MKRLIENYTNNFKIIDKILKVDLLFIGLFLFPLNIRDNAYVFFNFYYILLASIILSVDKLSLFLL